MSQDKTTMHRLGEVIYWTACGLAVLIAGFGVMVPFTDAGFDRHTSSENAIVLVPVFLIAALAWGAGRAVLYVTSGK